MTYVIFLDVDGTLINYQAKLPESAKEALIQAMNNGHKIFVCTGCSKAEIAARNLPKINGIIGGNGSYIECDDEVLFHEPLSLEECTKFVNWCKKNNLAHRLECNSGMYISDDYEEKSKLARFYYQHGKDADISLMPETKLPAYMHENENMYRDDCNKTAFVLNTYDDYLNATKVFSNLKVDTWGGKGEHALYVAVMRPNITKYTSVKEVIKYFDGYKSIAFGDAVVDIPMFEACDTSVAMGNASDEVKKASDYVTDDVDNDGLYNAFKQFNII